MVIFRAFNFVPDPICFALGYLFVGAVLWMLVSDHHINFVKCRCLKRGRVATTTDLGLGILLVIFGWPVALLGFVVGAVRAFR